jgi:1,4-dihydroxy-2-naphthoate octaprenyltransferase
MKALLNYIGQLRIYSLLDLIILLVAIKANPYEFIGIIFLHISFLAYLESKHKHSYRRKTPEYIWITLTFIGLILYRHIEGLLFILCSYIYTLKNKKYFALVSPIMRGLQYFFLIAGVIGYDNKLIWVVLFALTIRNFCGDLRDTTKDKKEGLKTLPIVMGLNIDIKYIHLVATIVTTFIWFQYTNLTPLLLIPIFLIQIYTYNLTPR